MATDATTTSEDFRSDFGVSEDSPSCVYVTFKGRRLPPPLMSRDEAFAAAVFLRLLILEGGPSARRIAEGIDAMSHREGVAA